MTRAGAGGLALVTGTSAAALDWPPPKIDWLEPRTAWCRPQQTSPSMQIAAAATGDLHCHAGAVPRHGLSSFNVAYAGTTLLAQPASQHIECFKTRMHMDRRLGSGRSADTIDAQSCILAQRRVARGQFPQPACRLAMIRA
jgi:hypothetical protein